jgi:hypothetical protein
MAKFTLDGKHYQISDHIPRGGIEWLMARLHVSTSDAEIRADICSRATKAGWNDALREQACLYALHCHRKNQALYRSVVSGRI